ncbi:tetratricopeptide repeat protein [Methylobacterium sp. J-090]|uniref:tetratricopeptide repeat protein n=1 Tax=Methylobacterium sp. J-090 TaxID=2836666 RepID=UPI001FBAA713|nr:tetratricopeptide repeat protein [Methylobacterium sp. J-090]MCJ2084296.1 tetratricopeptide repeat protein [Methylobacterium sp. J-090]
MRDLSIGSCNAIGSIVPTVVLGILLAGCQTGSDQGIAVVPGVEATLPAANELYNVGRINLAAGNSGLAERNFREAVQRNDKDASSWLGLAAAYDNLGRYELADRAYEQATSLIGETLEIVNNRGYSFMLRGNGKRALEQFERARILDPSNSVILNNIQILGLAQRPTRSAPF